MFYNIFFGMPINISIPIKMFFAQNNLF